MDAFAPLPIKIQCPFKISHGNFLVFINESLYRSHRVCHVDHSHRIEHGAIFERHCATQQILACRDAVLHQRGSKGIWKQLAFNQKLEVVLFCRNLHEVSKLLFKCSSKLTVIGEAFRVTRLNPDPPASTGIDPVMKENIEDQWYDEHTDGHCPRLPGQVRVQATS